MKFRIHPEGTSIECRNGKVKRLPGTRRWNEFQVQSIEYDVEASMSIHTPTHPPEGTRSLLCSAPGTPVRPSRALKSPQDCLPHYRPLCAWMSQLPGVSDELICADPLIVRGIKLKQSFDSLPILFVSAPP
ncbi:hypothetical protein JAAARDRAFT_33665 [Jaapia argillacea MUCL 33604]|uniref:Uncharacterized protein n=1 Tax=Jaapia argillacea MUCL 33604 TaxID=933084 RepID=A0A067PW71_9AGAM|nr:hypothetical protein JAAARDRAFT_33665 [Jaapia argillacea MUCL 33604]